MQESFDSLQSPERSYQEQASQSTQHSEASPQDSFHSPEHSETSFEQLASQSPQHSDSSSVDLASAGEEVQSPQHSEDSYYEQGSPEQSSSSHQLSREQSPQSSQSSEERYQDMSDSQHSSPERSLHHESSSTEEYEVPDEFGTSPPTAANNNVPEIIELNDTQFDEARALEEDDDVVLIPQEIEVKTIHLSVGAFPLIDILLFYCRQSTYALRHGQLQMFIEFFLTK